MEGTLFVSVSRGCGLKPVSGECFVEVWVIKRKTYREIGRWAENGGQWNMWLEIWKSWWICSKD